MGHAPPVPRDELRAGPAQELRGTPRRVRRNVIDFIVIDEIHYAKHREPGTLMSKRQRLVQGMVLETGQKNGELYVLGMSGTLVINTLQEGNSLVEMTTGIATTTSTSCRPSRTACCVPLVAPLLGGLRAFALSPISPAL